MRLKIVNSMNFYHFGQIVASIFVVILVNTTVVESHADWRC